MPLSSGARLGPYELVGLIGAGGMGEVYRARDSRLGRDVAVKILPPDLASDPDRLKRFEREARAAAALNHPNLIALYDIGDDAGTSFIVTELLDGGTLRQLLAGQRLPVNRIVELAGQIADGLAAAHACGIVHRDIKPDNIFVTQTGRAKILDFGLAKSVAMPGNQAALEATTQAGTEPHLVLGTVGYMSPEQLRGQAIDYRTDIFAFGVVLYELLAGRRAFDGGTKLDAMTAVLRETPAPLVSTVDVPLPPALVRIVERCLEKAPAARFQSTTDLAFALKSLSAPEPFTRAGSAAVTTPVASHWRALAGWIVSGALLLAVVMLLWHPWVRSAAAPAAAVVRFAIAPPDGLDFAPTTANVAPFAAVSPDGQQLVFSAGTADGPVSLWLQSLKSGDVRLLAGTGTRPYMAFWSPNNQSIAFFTDNKLKRIDVNTGAVQTLCDVPGPHGGAWGADDTIVFASGDPSGATSSLSRVNAAGGTPVALLSVPPAEGVSLRQPAFLPDGRHFLYQSAPDHWIWVGSLSGQPPTRVLQADSRALYAAPGYLLFARHTRLFAQRFDADRLELSGEATLLAEDIRLTESNGRAAFTVSSNGVLVYRTGDLNGEHTLAWFDAGGQMGGGVKDSTARYQRIWLLPDERSIVAEIYDPAQNGSGVWRIDLESGTRTRLTPAARDDGNPILSPDGASVAWTARAHPATILRGPTNGAGAESPWVTVDGPVEPTDWSAHWIVFNRGNESTKRDLWVAPVDAPAKPQLYLAGAVRGRLSPDEKWMAYQSDETGRSGVYVRPFPDAAGGKWLVSGNVTANSPLWTDGGKQLLFVAQDEATLMSVTVSTAGGTFTMAPPLRAVLRRVGLSGSHLAVTRDGRRVLVSTPPASSGVDVPLTVIVNWPGLMPGR